MKDSIATFLVLATGGLKPDGTYMEGFYPGWVIWAWIVGMVVWGLLMGALYRAAWYVFRGRGSKEPDGFITGFIWPKRLGFVGNMLKVALGGISLLVAASDAAIFDHNGLLRWSIVGGNFLAIAFAVIIDELSGPPSWR